MSDETVKQLGNLHVSASADRRRKGLPMLFADIEPLSATVLYQRVKDTLSGPHAAYLNTISHRARVFSVRRRRGSLQVRVVDDKHIRWVPVGHHSITLYASSFQRHVAAIVNNLQHKDRFRLYS